MDFGERRALGFVGDQNNADRARALVDSLERTMNAEVIWIEPKLSGCRYSATCWLAATRGSAERGPPVLLVSSSSASSSLEAVLVTAGATPEADSALVLRGKSMDDLVVAAGAALRERGYLRVGEIEIDCGPGAKVSIDGRQVGVTDSDRALLTSVPEGPHTLRLDRSGFESHRSLH